MRKTLKLITVFSLIILSCSDKKTEKHQIRKIQYKMSIIPQIINGFVNSIIQDNGTKFVSIDFTEAGDTIVMTLVNTFPDFNYAQFQFCDTLHNHTIIFIGKMDKNFYEISDKMDAPKELLDLSEKTYHGIMPPPAINPKQWHFYFKDYSMIDYYPKEDIKRFIHLAN